MRCTKWISLILMLALLTLPVNGMAKTKPIKLGFKVGIGFEGDSAQLNPKLRGVEASWLKYESSDSAVVSVSDTGMVQCVGVGRSVITVSSGGEKARCGIVSLPRRVSVGIGETVKLPNGRVEKYQVKDSEIAEVSSSGEITGRAAGVTVVAVEYGRRKLNVQVEVAGGGASAQDQSKAASLSAASQTDQIVLVEYTGGSNATLSVHEKKNGAWTQLAEMPAYVGKNGIGKTVAGDKKTPTGTYNLNTPFGIKEDPGAKLDYTQVTKYHYWCGTSNSGYYNQFVDSRVTGRECTSSDEHLIDYKGVYNYCMFIDYNADGEAGKGSCIFLHCMGSNKYTAGCVAVSESNMKKIIQWARPGAKIVIQKKQA